MAEQDKAAPDVEHENPSTGAHPVSASAILTALGIVFGDLGTSPLYTVSVTLKASSSGGTVAPEAVLGIVSLIFWSLIVVISIKYALLIMRADNHGEGGILALLALISPRRARQSRRRAVMVVIGLLGATLLYGDGAITPAISVLSAIEGLKVYAPQTDAMGNPIYGGGTAQSVRGTSRGETQFLRDRRIFNNARVVSAAFWDTYLKNDTAARDYLKAGGTLDQAYSGGQVIAIERR